MGEESFHNVYVHQIFMTHTLNSSHFYKGGKIINIVYSYNGIVLSIWKEWTIDTPYKRSLC